MSTSNLTAVPKEPKLRPDPERDARETLAAMAETVRAGGKLRFIEYVRNRIDLDRFEAAQASHLSSDDYRVKYLDLAFYLMTGYRKAIKCRLNKKRGLNILDLGCGPGYFSLAAQFFKHGVVGLDLAGNAINDDLNAIFGTVKLCHTIQPMTPLPIRGFDLITAFCGAFIRKSNDLYSEAEWDFFIDDLRSRLNPGGRIRLQLNKIQGTSGVAPGTDAFVAMIERHGGRLASNGFIVEIDG